MKRLIAISAIIALSALPVMAGQKKQCEVSCNPEFVEADKALNQLWKSIEPDRRESWKPSQRGWVKYRDKKCKKNDQCLIKETNLRISEIWEVVHYGEADNDLKLTQDQKDCLAGDGGLACFDKW